MRLVGEYAGGFRISGVFGVGNGDVVSCCVDAGDVEVVERRDEGASMRKLHVSPFLSQFPHDGCLQSHYSPNQYYERWNNVCLVFLQVGLCSSPHR